MFSFGFSKRSQVKRLNPSAINEGDTSGRAETDYVESFEANKIKSVKCVSDVTSFVIPLTQSWQYEKKPSHLVEAKSDTNCLKAVANTTDIVTQIAIEELLTDVAANNKKQSTDSNACVIIPQSMPNRIPLTHETDDHVDLHLQPSPNEAIEEDYEKMPIEQFGLAMLRGMGWKDGQGIGKNQRVVNVSEPVLQPKGLGLGADRSIALPSSKTQNFVFSDTCAVLSLKKGAYCVFVGGRYDGLYGTIAGLDEDNARVVVALAIGNEVTTVPQFAVRVVSSNEFQTCSKYINLERYKNMTKFDGSKHGMVTESKFTAKEASKKAQHNDRWGKRLWTEANSGPEVHGHHGSEKVSYEVDQDQQHANMQTYETHFDFEAKRCCNMLSQRLEEPLQKDKHIDHTRMARAAVWVQPHLRVRIVDKLFRRGAYYKMKVTVIDVLCADICICQTNDGHVLDDLKQSQLETVIPHKTPAQVMIVSGKYYTQLGLLLKRNKDNSCADIQLVSDPDIALTLDFDAICEYTSDDFN